MNRYPDVPDTGKISLQKAASVFCLTHRFTFVHIVGNKILPFTHIFRSGGSYPNYAAVNSEQQLTTKNNVQRNRSVPVVKGKASRAQLKARCRDAPEMERNDKLIVSHEKRNVHRERM